MEFELIKNIRIEDENTYIDKVFLTIDVEWVNDEIFDFLLDILIENNIKTTFFCTHYTPIIDKIRKNSNFELGIHPNFNFLLNGDFRYGKNVEEVIDYYLDIVPDALSYRSHCLINGTQLTSAFREKGLIYDCNNFIPFNLNCNFKPWSDFIEGIIKVPLIWEDDIHCMYNWKYSINDILKNSGIKVFNFHPMFIYLNIEKYSSYLENKKYYNITEKLKENINSGYGTKDFFSDLIMHSQDFK